MTITLDNHRAFFARVSDNLTQGFFQRALDGFSGATPELRRVLEKPLGS